MTKAINVITAAQSSLQTNSARLNTLQERVLREVETRMSLVTDDEDWKPPTQAAIDLGLHYTYLAHALSCGELTVAIQAVTTTKGKTKLVVMNMTEVNRWYADCDDRAQAAGKTIEQYLSDQYNMGRVLISTGGEEPPVDGRPTDLIPVDIAGQLLVGRDLPAELLTDAIERQTIEVYRVGREKMVSEAAIVLLSISPNAGDEEAVVVEDTGECDLVQAAERLSIDANTILAAVEAGECVGRRDGDLWIVKLADVVTWYDDLYEVPSGQRRVRYVLVDARPEHEAGSHYDTVVTVKLQVPNISAILNNISTDVLTKAVDQQMKFERNKPVPVGRDIGNVSVDVQMSVGTLMAMTYLADISGQTPDSYMAWVAYSTAGV